MNQDLPPLTTKASDQAPLPALSREMMLFGISLVYGYLDRIEAAKSQEQFDTALALVRSQIKGIADQLSAKPSHNPYRRIYVQAARDSRNIARSCK